MLRLVNIKKEYKVADIKVEALKGISLSFRKNEFVSILGPSGCGKTTTLNIVGGLDKYSSGDLFINGKSTKEFKDRDWDIYRNHRVGFIFQSYNLIPHQTILGNVELALTIAGISTKERTKRAKKALDEVGLKGQYYKKPNQLSGGQCQRVAIARALVNEPEILLADEPTGALDTVTSVQIMNLIKKISQDKLVIMVTHNPDLAEKYSSRIIRLLDGEVQEDTNPYSAEEEMKEEQKAPKNEKAKMNWWTSFKLSFKNLLSKRGRSILVSIAGSIGIIGVASVLSVSSGVNDYITNMQDDMLSGNPIQISENAYDLSTITSLMSTSEKSSIAKEVLAGNVNVDYLLDQILEAVGKSESFSISNDINSNYLEFIEAMPESYYSDLTYTYGYGLENNFYTEFTKANETSTRNLSLSSILTNYESVLEKVDGIGDYSSYITSLVSTIKQLPAHNSYIEKQYDILTGTLPTSSDEVLLVLDSDSKLSDLLLAELGYFTQDEFVDLAKNSKKIVDGVDGASHDNDISLFSYETILNHKFYYVPNYQTYTYSGNNITVESLSLPTFNYMNELTDTTLSGVKEIKISGIIQPKDGISYGCLSSGLYYTEDLAKQMYTDAMIDVANAITNGTWTLGALVQAVETLPNGSTTPTVTYTNEYYNYSTSSYETSVGYVGETSEVSSFLSTYISGYTETKTITSRYLGTIKTPTNINIYPKSFDEKNQVTDYLDQWNSEDYEFTLSDGTILTYNDRSKVTYTDNVGVIISMVKTLINIITYALIAFTALSLVVSCFMIAIITYVSVMERVKEIGVIRSLGGRKKDVSRLFTAETFMLGFSSGVIGVIITALITLGINVIGQNLAGANIAAFYPYHVFAMILLSVLLTVLSGALPARGAAKQDPVNALRSE